MTVEDVTLAEKHAAGAFVEMADDYPIEIVRRAKAMNVHPARLMPHEGPGECLVCGCKPGEQHHLASHDAAADLEGGY